MSPSGSHGGVIAAWYAATAGVRAVVLHDAGIGKDEAGVAGLPWLEAIGIAAAAVAHTSARIGDGADMLARGVVSRANRIAQACGVRPRMPCADAAGRLLTAPVSRDRIPAYEEGRHELSPGVRGMDSIGMLQPEDAGRILVIGSHGALHGGRPESALPVAAAFAAFNDAGGGAISRLPVLEARGVAAATVDAMTARIGDCRSMWASGVISRVNAVAAPWMRTGMALRAAVEAIRSRGAA